MKRIALLLRKLAGAIAISIFLSACGATLSMYQSARTIKKGKLAAGYGISVSSRNNYDLTLDGDTLVEGNVPIVDLYTKYGITDKIDAGLKWGVLSGEIIANGKYNFLGEEGDEFFGSAGLELGYSKITSELKVNEIVTSSRETQGINVYFPAYFSYNPSDYFALYAHPKYIVRFINFQDNIAAFETNKTAHLYGVTVGTMIGFHDIRKSGLWGESPRMFIEFTFMNDSELRNDIWQIGFGAAYNIR